MNNPNLISFPREDSSAPRQMILKEYCPVQLTKFREVNKTFIKFYLFIFSKKKKFSN